MGIVPGATLLAATEISVGEHIQKKVAGLTLNMDTVWATGAALVVVILLGLALRRQVTSGVPGRLQAAWEVAVATFSCALSRISCARSNRLSMVMGMSSGDGY